MGPWMSVSPHQKRSRSQLRAHCPPPLIIIPTAAFIISIMVLVFGISQRTVQVDVIPVIGVSVAVHGPSLKFVLVCVMLLDMHMPRFAVADKPFPEQSLRQFFTSFDISCCIAILAW